MNEPSSEPVELGHLHETSRDTTANNSGTPVGMMQEQTHKDTGGAIVFDATVSADVGHDWFSQDYWQSRDALHLQAGGRGGVAVIDTPVGECILRHYHRGGLIASVMADRYLWTGAQRTRSFAEFRLLGDMVRQGLPVPQVVAARYCRRGLFYTADLIMRRIQNALTLAECLAVGKLDATLAEAVGTLLARFHRAGIWHADLNAHNILVTPDQLYVIDFDRGRQRPPALAWRTANLQRLHRSLVKLGTPALPDVTFEHTVWQPLLDRYERTFNA